MAKQQPVPQLRTAGGIRYELTRKRVKNLNIRVREDGTVAVSIPLRTSAEAADRFVAARAAWVQQAQARARRRSLQDARPLPDKETALAHFTAMSEKVYPAFAGVLGGQKPTIKVRSMTSRWGVCHMAKRHKFMWWCTNTATFCSRTTARPSGPRWQSCCRTGRPGGIF